MGIVCGKETSTRITEQDKAILKLKQQRDKLKQHQRTIEQSLSKDKEIAKKLLSTGQKERAKLLLKKKIFQEQLLSQLDRLLSSLEQMIHDVEFVQIEGQVIDGLRVANATFKKVNDILNIKNVECILTETKEGIYKQNEIYELLSGKFTDEDESALEEELAQIINEQLPSVLSSNLERHLGLNNRVELASTAVENGVLIRSGNPEIDAILDKDENEDPKIDISLAKQENSKHEDNVKGKIKKEKEQFTYST